MNFFCEYDKKPATAFCFQGSKKLAVCKEHIEDCLSKKLDIYPLDGILFISSPSDVEAFRFVSSQSMKGLAYLQVLRAQINLELETGLDHLNNSKLACFQTITECFSSFEDQFRLKYKAAERVIEKLEEEMRNLTRIKGVKLSALAELMPETEREVKGVLGFMGWSGGKSMVREVFTGFRLEEIDPEEVIFQAINPVERLTRLQEMCERYEGLIGKSEYLDVLEAEYAVTVASGLSVEGSEKEEVERMRKEAERLGMERKVSEEREVVRMIGKWRDKGIVQKVVEDCAVVADTYKSSNSLETALHWALSGLELSTDLLPDSFSVVNAHLQVALIYQLAGLSDEAELQLADAVDLSVKLDPVSILTAKTYRRLGDLYADTGRPDEAEQSYKDALTIGLEHYSESADTAATYTNLGIFYESQNRLNEAETCWEKAWKLWTHNQDARAQTLVFPYLQELLTRSGRQGELVRFKS